MSSTKKLAVAVATLTLTSLSGCAGFMFRDPQVSRSFDQELSSYGTAIHNEDTTIDGLIADFDAGMAGNTPKVKEDPQFKSTMAKYAVVMKRYEDVKTQSKGFFAWTETVKENPTRQDLTRLQSDAVTVMRSQQNVDSPLRTLAAEITNLQRMAAYRH